LNNKYARPLKYQELLLENAISLSNVNTTFEICTHVTW